MRQAFNLGSKLKAFGLDIARMHKDMLTQLRKNAEISCVAMTDAAKQATPHSGDGKRRGFNVISDSLQKSWVGRFTHGSTRKVFGRIILENSRPYAIFVQKGHKVKKHFVPWLYIDSGGNLSRATHRGGKMFGLVVGTKTPYVKGVDMITPAINAFNSAFYDLSKDIVKDSMEKNAR